MSSAGRRPVARRAVLRSSTTWVPTCATPFERCGARRVSRPPRSSLSPSASAPVRRSLVSWICYCSNVFPCATRTSSCTSPLPASAATCIRDRRTTRGFKTCRRARICFPTRCSSGTTSTRLASTAASIRSLASASPPTTMRCSAFRHSWAARSPLPIAPRRVHRRLPSSATRSGSVALPARPT